MKTSKLWYRFIAKLLIYLMLIQGAPYWQLSELYSWEYKPERAKRIIEFIGSAFSPSEASAAPPQVVCVPQLPTDLLVPHDTWPGESVILKGIARDADDNLSGGTYYWDFGDGTQSPVQNISNADNLSTTHTYTDDAGTLIIARLYVTDAAGETSSDDYRVVIKAKTLDVEVNKAIDDGLWWLYTSKEEYNSYYRWNNARYGNHYNNSTASAVQAFEINGHLETGDPDEDPYVEVVAGGINYLFSQMSSVNIGDQTYGDPDANDNGIGITVSGNRQIYELGAVMDALVASSTPDAVALVGGANVVGRRYQDIVQDMCDMYAWGQYDHATVGGGWRYNWGDSPDNSASQWAAIGMIAAEQHFDCTIPQWVKDRNNVWLNYSDNSSGFGYANTAGTTFSTIASGMVQLAFDGFDDTDSRWQTAQSYVDNNWSSFISNSRDNRYYSYYSFTKAMRLAEPQEVTHLPSGLDWYGDEEQGLARILVDRQNTSGNWPYDGWPYVGESTAAAWNIIILTRTLFEKPPVAMIAAKPNPGAMGQQILLDASGSYHVDPAKTIVTYLWDFDASDGVDFDNPDATGISAGAVYGALGSYTVTLKVVDDSTPERFDTTTLSLEISIPPHPPTAVIGGPYIAVVGEDLQLDGSGSYDVDEPEGDGITAWDWETDFVAPYDFDEASGEVVTIVGFSQAGNYDIALRVTDNTATIFPQSGSADLTHMDYGQVTVFNPGVTDFAARPKATKCQLTWTDVGAAPYEVLRSSAGPNHGFELIGSTDSTYSTFMDYNVELNTDYWYRIRCVHNSETTLSGPVHVYSLGRIRNLPPIITSSPVVDAQEAQAFNYDVEADDPEGTTLTYYLDQAPNGMTIDAATGLITWTPAFADVGLTDVTVRVEDAGKASASQFFQITVQPRPNTAPIPDHGGPYEGLINTAVSFDAGGTSDPEGDPIASFHWNFGDGTEGYGQTIVHTYTAPATYTVTLYVIDDRGATASAETVCQIESPNRPPAAVITGPDAGEADVPMAFSALDSSDPDGDSLTYTWNFGDSTSAETGNTVLHTYDTAGTYTVSLSADDGRGGLDTAELEVVISEPNQTPEAVFTVSGDLTRLATVTFDGSASSDPEGGGIASYNWDFGDGIITTGQIVTHTFNSVDSFTVTLTVTDDKGLEGTTSQTINIAEIMVTVPDVTGQPRSDAQADIIAAELVVGTVSELSSEIVPAGSVISQNPAAGESVAIQSSVDLTISTGPPMIVVPNVTNTPQADAQAAILAADLTVGVIEYQYSVTIPEGQVISQNPVAGSSVVIGSSVNVVVSLGNHQLVTVPDVIGMPQADAQALITSVSLAVGTITTQYHNTVPAGNVISSDPVAGTQVIDTTPVNLVVSLGIQMVAVPDIVGQNQLAATSAISTAGLLVGTITEQMDFDVPEGQVLSQNPIGGSSVPSNSAVNFTVAVHRDVVPPQVNIKLSVNPIPPGQFTQITVTATDNLAVTQTGLTVNGVMQDLDANNQCWYQAGGEGTATVSAFALDAAGNTGTGTAQLVISNVDDNNPPVVSMTYSPANPTVGDAIDFTIAATDDAGIDIDRIWLKVDGIYVPVIDGHASYTTNRQGNIPAVASAYDLSGNYGQDAQNIPVTMNGNATAAPSVAITAPTDEEEILGMVDVTGTADDTDLAYYTLSYRADGESDFVEYYRSDVAVNNDVLGPFDGTLLENGLYTLLLTAVDIYGGTTSDSVKIYVSGEQKIGNFTLSFNDMSLNLSGIDIEVVRTYDSRVKNRRDFGVGWSLAVKQSASLNENVEPGVGWETYCTKSLWGTCLGWGVQSSRDHDVTIEIPGVRKQEFRASVVTTYASSNGIAQGYIKFEAESGTYTTLEALDNTSFDFLMGGELLDFDFNVINPNRYRLTLLDGTQYYYNQDSRAIYRIVDANGNSVDISDSGIMHSSGAQVQFIRDGEGRITSIQDSAGRTVDYTYDGLGNLSTSADPNGNVTRYKYAANHYLDEIIDPRGIAAVRTEYDDEGRMTRQVNANGDEIEYDHNTENQQETVTDLSGNQTQYEYDENGWVTIKTDTLGNTWEYEYDANGNVIQTINPDGTVTAATFDTKDNKLTETDELGQVTTYTYDASGRRTSWTDHDGRTTQIEYDSRGNLLREIGPDGTVVTEREYNSRGDVISKIDAIGNETRFTYDTQGRKLTETNALGNVTTFTYDSRGNVLTQTDARGFTTTYTYDDNDNQLTETDAFGNVIVRTYTSFDKIHTITDKLGRVTEYMYDVFGQKVGTRYPDGTTETVGFDENGNKVLKTDADGRKTRFSYDSENNLLATEYPDGTVIQYEYDTRGRKTAQIDGNDHRTEYEYDAAGRNILIRDALNNETHYEYDAAGNQVAMIDALGRRTEYDFDGYSRQVAARYVDDTESTFSYDNVGRKISETDPAGQTTQFGYDAEGHLIHVIDAMGGITEYSYDEAGNKLSQTDPNGNTTSWVYDSMNRVISKTLPGGQTESFTYNAVGNMVARTDFNGNTTTFVYDDCDRLLSKTFSDGSSTDFTYTLMGQRSSVTYAGLTTSYTYDLRDRPIKVSNPDGSVLTYSYDANGNRTELGTPSGTTEYTYDDLNRLAAVSTQEGVTTYQYDDVGNRDRVFYPNGTVTTYVYDDRNRLIQQSSVTSASTILSNFTYVLGPAGNRLQVSEYSGRTVTYDYDPLYRLVEENIVDADSGNETITYTYDGFGNRLSKTDGAGTTDYTYDENDRLIVEAGPVTTWTYSYDENGNILNKSDGLESATYTYDFENRMISAQTPISATSFVYDADGVRIGSNTDGDITTYLVDKNRQYAQVLEERDSTDALIVSYLYGEELISQQRGGAVRYYLYDGQMSTRLLIDSGETIKDEYTFDAFGILIGQVGVTQNNYLYTGQQYDPNVGYYYLRARYYDQYTGRFLSVDPLDGLRFEPATLHKYLYALNDPINKEDPSGEFVSIGFISGLNFRVTTALSAIRTAFTVSRSLGGAALRTLGLVVENAAGQILRQIPGAAVRGGIRLVGQGGTRVLDFWVKAAGRVAIIEVKYGLPRAVGPAMTRLVGQMQTALTAQAARQAGAQVVLFTYRAPSAAQMSLLMSQLGSQAGMIQHVHGLWGLVQWARFFFLLP